MGSQQISKRNIQPIPNSKKYLNVINSKYILRQIVDNINLRLFLKIIKENKDIKNRLDINIDNYKNSSQIVIDITPLKNSYGDFINIFDKENEKYFHIYFNKSKNIINRNYILEGEKVKNIKIKIDYKIKSIEKLFKDCETIESILQI